MINTSEILQTVRMITEEKLDIRTITMGISLYECVHPDKKILYQNVYDRITTQARDLVKTGETLEREFGIPIVNKRISVTPASLVAAACGDPVVVARAMDAAAKETGVNYIGGYTALVQKGMTASDRALIASLPEALSTTERVCSSVNVASTRAGIDMDAVRLCGQAVKDIAAATADTDAIRLHAKLVVFANAVEDNPVYGGRVPWAGRRRLRASTSGFPAPAWSSARWKTRRRGSRSTWWPRRSSARRLRLRAWVSWLPRRPPRG